MTNPIIRIHDTQTDEVIDREMNAAELKQYEQDQKRNADKETDAQTKAAAKSALLDRMGLTEDEAQLLLS